MAIRLARTNAEAHLFMELNQCEHCGERESEPSDPVWSDRGLTVVQGTYRRLAEGVVSA